VEISHLFHCHKLQVEELISLVCAHLPDPKILDPLSQTDGMKLENSDAAMKTEPSTDDT